MEIYLVSLVAQGTMGVWKQAFKTRENAEKAIEDLEKEGLTIVEYDIEVVNLNE